MTSRIILTGRAGRSAYAVAVANGFEGSEAEWVASLEGDPGPMLDPALLIDVTGPLTFDPELHFGAYFIVNSETEVTITLPATVTRGDGFMWLQEGAGAILFAPVSGPLLNSMAHTRSWGVGSSGGAFCYRNTGGNAGKWHLTGETRA